MSQYDLVVTGAGPSGLIAAHTWLTLNPESRVILFEADSTVGGAWSKDRVYPTMMTQTPVGMLEFSHYPMNRPTETFYDLCSGDHVYRYLDDFSQSTKFAGLTVRDRIHFNTRATSIEKSDQGWFVRTSTGEEVHGHKLVIATGPTSQPQMPSFCKRVDNKIPLLHSRDLGRSSALLASSETRNFIVVGGSKSAFDAVYLLSKSGKSVSWVIRQGGHGPGLLAGADGGGLFENSHEIISLKFIAKMSPCVFEPDDWWLRFFHQSGLGKWLVKNIWSLVDGMWRAAAGYGKRGPSFSKLTPDRSAYWCSDNIGVQNTADLWDVVSQATIYRDEVEEISKDGIAVLSSTGEKIKCDALVVCTGWDVTYPMFTPETAFELGLPIAKSNVPSENAERWNDLYNEADTKILTRFPSLAHPPTPHSTKSSTFPNRLYRSLVPPSDVSDRSIVFLGQVGSTQSFLVAEIQSLWAVAYLSNEFPHPKIPSLAAMEEEVALRTAWRRRRYLSDGNSMIYDQIAYQSLLLRDLGINDLRKGGGWKELLRPYSPKDYRGVIDELLRGREKKS
jgi:dimethylaniline monooxygenase (N-oxide forming)